MAGQVQGRLVRCVPPTAHEEIKNVDQARDKPRLLPRKR